MNEALVRINNIPIYGYGLLAVFAFLWGSFVFYKKAMESHFEDKAVLDCVVLCGFWAFIAGRLGFALLNWGTFVKHWSRLFLLTNYPGLDRWGVIMGVAFGLWLCVRKTKAKFMDWFDLVCVGISSGTAIFMAGLAAMTGVWQYVVLAVLFLAVFIYFWRAEQTYRVLDWYRNKKTSARSGYIAGLSIASWGLLYLAETLLLNICSWVCIIWVIVLFVGGVVLVYIRSGRTVAEDIKTIFKHGKR